MFIDFKTRWIYDFSIGVCQSWMGLQQCSRPESRCWLEKHLLWHRVFSRAHMTAGKMKPFTVPELTEAHLPKPQDGVSLTLCPLLKVHLIRSSLLKKSILHNSKSAHLQPEISFSTNELQKGGSCGSFPSKAAIPCRGGGRGLTEGFVEEAPAFSSLSLWKGL